ncbi:MAG: hypothetical protein R2800_06585 [Flavipsychrobacter sp.]
MEQYTLGKSIWKVEDYEDMSWQDANVYAMSFVKDAEEALSGNLVLDIDYIFEWVDNDDTEEHYSFWVAPCTLVFSNVLNFKMSIDKTEYNLDLIDIADIHLLEKTPVEEGGFWYSWQIELADGEITFSSEDMYQVVRQQPIYTDSQVLTLEERGGVSFSVVPM